MPFTMFKEKFSPCFNRLIMDLLQIYKPIGKDLSQFEVELLNIANCCTSEYSQKIIKVFFSVKGKYLRPALIFLSARAATTAAFPPQKETQLIKLATAIELMHSASLIHDDVIDEDLIRRGQKTINNNFGDKVAVLVGDLLFSKAFFMVSNSLPPLFTQELSRLTETMCSAEIEQAGNSSQSATKESYLRVIQGKTASFMSLCCKLGGLLADEKGTAVQNLQEYGLNFGMTYQILDDSADNDPVAAEFQGQIHAEEYTAKAKNALAVLPGSIYKEGLLNLLDHTVSKSHQ